jgi:CspA family cold shock protein
MNRNRDFRGPRGRGGRDDFGSSSRDSYGGPPGGEDFGARRSFDSPQPGWGEAPRTPVASGPPQDATVKWFNPEKGFGFVELADGSGDAFLHIRVVEGAGQTEMAPGTRLTVRTAQGQKGPQVTEILEVDASTAEPARPRSPMGAPRRSFGDAPRQGGPRFAGPPSEEQEGTVKWYNPAKGFGFIAVEDGGKDVFVHRSALMRAGLPDLQEGQRVLIQTVEGQKGREVASISAAG